MNRHHRHTLEALFAHPLQHGVRSSRVEALFRSLGAEVTPLEGRRLRLQMPSGAETWIHHGCGMGQPDLSGEEVMRVRHFLQEQGISPSHPEPEPASAAAEPRQRLVLHLSHAHTDAYLLDGEAVEHAVLRPHGLWGSGENLTHRHSRDIAGQRAPLDNDYLSRLAAAMAAADAVLLVGHGTGESDMRQVLLTYLHGHHRELLDRVVGVVTLAEAHPSPDALLALAREHFGERPARRPLVAPGQPNG